VAVGNVILPIGSARPPDGTASNLAPAIIAVKGSATAPTPYFAQAAFDAAQTEQLMWAFACPANYASGPELHVQWKAGATSGNVRWEGRLAAYTPGTDSTGFDAKAFAAANNTTTAAGATTAQRIVETVITLTNADSLAANDTLIVYLARLGADAADTMTGDALAVAVTFQYTTV
jgi:hypothetical protein